MEDERVTNFVKHGRKIVAIGKNYWKLAEEEKYDPPKEPMTFMKPVSCYITEGQNMKLVKGWEQVHHEVELGLIIGKKGYQIPESEAMDYIGGYCLALDMTAREYLREKLRPTALPWALAKCFETSCPVSKFIPKDKVKDPQNLDLWCKVNGELRQSGNTGDMVFKIPYIIKWMSEFFTLEPGDMVLTGTPSGIGPVRSGDVVEAGIKDIIEMTFYME